MSPTAPVNEPELATGINSVYAVNTPSNDPLEATPLLSKKLGVGWFTCFTDTYLLLLT